MCYTSCAENADAPSDRITCCQTWNGAQTSFTRDIDSASSFSSVVGAARAHLRNQKNNTSKCDIAASEVGHCKKTISNAWNGLLWNRRPSPSRDRRKTWIGRTTITSLFNPPDKLYIFGHRQWAINTMYAFSRSRCPRFCMALQWLHALCGVNHSTGPS